MRENGYFNCNLTSAGLHIYALLSIFQEEMGLCEISVSTTDLVCCGPSEPLTLSEL